MVLVVRLNRFRVEQALLESVTVETAVTIEPLNGFTRAACHWKAMMILVNFCFGRCGRKRVDPFCRFWSQLCNKINIKLTINYLKWVIINIPLSFGGIHFGLHLLG